MHKQAALSKHFSLFGALQFESDVLCQVTKGHGVGKVEMPSLRGPSDLLFLHQCQRAGHREQWFEVGFIFQSHKTQDLQGSLPSLRRGLQPMKTTEALRHKFARLFEMSSLS